MKVIFNTDKVRKHIAVLGVSGHSFAYDCEVGRHAWDSIMAERSIPRLETAYKIATQMGLKIDELLIIEK